MSVAILSIYGTYIILIAWPIVHYYSVITREKSIA